MANDTMIFIKQLLCSLIKTELTPTTRNSKFIEKHFLSEEYLHIIVVIQWLLLSVTLVGRSIRGSNHLRHLLCDYSREHIHF